MSVVPPPLDTAPLPAALVARTLGRGALVVASAYVVLSVGRPLLVLLFGQADDGAFLAPEIAASPSSQIVGVFVSVVFFAIAAGLLMIRSGMARLSGDASGTWHDVVLATAVIAAAAYALVGGLGRAMLSMFAGALVDTGADAAAQVAALHIGNLVTGGAAIAAAATTSVVLVGIATLGRRAGIVGLPSAIAAWIGAALLVVGYVGFAFGPVQFVVPVVFFVIAIAALRRVRQG